VSEILIPVFVCSEAVVRLWEKAVMHTKNVITDTWR